MGFPHGSDGKESSFNAGDLGSIRGLGRTLGERNGQPIPVFVPGDSPDRGVWQATVYGVAELYITEWLST